jgi:AGZA family xanthine/uracil permease-like MFS transporter
VSKSRYPWAASGDVNAFFGLMLDNVAGLLLAVSLLSQVFQFPVEFALRYMVPGTAIGVFVGDLLFTLIAIRQGRRTGRNDITAMPLGLDTPSTFGMVFFVLGPAYSVARREMDVEAAAYFTWQVGICALFTSGVFKFACAFVAGRVHRVVPRAGLLGSLAAIALVLISFLPFLELARFPVAGFAALAIILGSLVARLRLPGRVPGALGALAVSGVIFFTMRAAGWHGPDLEVEVPRVWLPSEWMSAWSFSWRSAWDASLQYLPVVIPFALATVVGGIDCAESAAAAGDRYDTSTVIAVEAFATLVAALCGGVIQTTPYIGHPAYKAMGGRSAYTLATAFFVGGAGVVGYFSVLYNIIPRPAVFPILVFVGLEITAQSFHATPKRHYSAVALACVPAMAALVMSFAERLIALRVDPASDVIDLVQLSKGDLRLAVELQTVRILSAGFIITSLLWAALLAHLVDRRLLAAAACGLIAAILSLFGVIHSPFPGGRMFVPWGDLDLPVTAAGQTPFHFAAGYAVVALILAAWAMYSRDDAPTF